MGACSANEEGSRFVQYCVYDARHLHVAGCMHFLKKKSIDRKQCSMTAPSCANCTRRNEECEYPDFIDVPGSSLALARSESRNRSLESLYQATGGVDGHLHADLQYRPVNQSHDLQAIIAPSIDQTVGSLLKYIMVQSWFAPQETQLWSAAILKNATKYKYLQHCIYGLALLRRDLTDRQAPFKTAPEAFDHQVAASALFRLEAPVCVLHFSRTDCANRAVIGHHA